MADNTTKHSYHNVKAVPEVATNVVTYSMVQQVSVASGEFPKVSMSSPIRLTPIASKWYVRSGEGKPVHLSAR